MTLFNGKSKIKDRSEFITESAVYHVLMVQKAHFRDRKGRELTLGDIDDTFIQTFIRYLRKNHVIISYRDFRAETVNHISTPSSIEESPS